MAPVLQTLTALWSVVGSDAKRQVVLQMDSFVNAGETFRASSELLSNGTTEGPAYLGKFVRYYDDDTTNFDEFMLPNVRHLVTVGVRASTNAVLETNNPKYDDGDGYLRQYVRGMGDAYKGIAKWLSKGYGAKLGGHRMIGKQVHLDAASGIRVSELDRLIGMTRANLLQAVIFDWDRTLTVTNGLPCPKRKGLGSLMRRLRLDKIAFRERHLAEFFFGKRIRHTKLQEAFRLLQGSNVQVYILTKNTNIACMTDFIVFGLLGHAIGSELPDGWQIISTKGNKYEAFRAAASADTLGVLNIPVPEDEDEELMPVSF